MTSESGTACSLSGPPPYDLRGCDLSRMNLGGKDLSNAKLQNAKLFGTIFNGVLSLTGADLSGAVMGNGTDFTGCDLSKVNFGPKPQFGTNPYGLTKFVAATIPCQSLGSDWNYLDLTDAVVTGVQNYLGKVTLRVRYSNLSGFNFADCNLPNARFEGVALPGANFSHATLTGATFAPALSMRCDLTGANLPGITMDSGSFADSLLSRADFTGSTLGSKQGRVSFARSSIEGTRFDGIDLTGCDFTGVARSSSRTNLTSFRGAKLKLMTFATKLSYLDLAGATIDGLDDLVKGGGSLPNLEAQYSVLTGLSFAGGKLTNANLTGATLAGVNFTGTSLDGAQMCGVKSTYEIFRVSKRSEYDELSAALKSREVSTVSKVFGANHYPLVPDKTTIHSEGSTEWIVTDGSTKVTYLVDAVTADGASSLVVTNPSRVTRFDKAVLTGANLGPDDGTRTVLRGATFNGATLDGADLRQVDLGPVDPSNPATAAQFAGAKMTGVTLSQAALDGAKLAGAFMHGANLAGATLKGADLAGAQLGSLTTQFMVGESSAHYQAFLKALDGGDGDGVAEAFGASNHPLGWAAGTEIKMLVPKRSWMVQHPKSSIPYTVLNWTSSKGDKSLIVATPTKAATLTGAYMPNARLTDANLTDVAASGLQLYGDVRLDGAILDGAVLSGANLGGSGLGVKALHGVDLSYANLINSKIVGVDLTNRVVLSYASLQGADFTGSKLDKANLEYAAVSVKLAGTSSGTYLFKISDPSSAVFKDVTAELAAVSDPQFPIILAPNSDAPSVDQCLRYLSEADIKHMAPIFTDRGLQLPAGARIEPTSDADAWQIVSSTAKGGFNVWRGVNTIGGVALFARPVTPKLQEMFKTNRANTGTLRWQATISEAGPGRWEIDNDSANPKNFQLGYVNIAVIQSDNALLFYGTTLHIERLGDDHTTQIVPVTLAPTILGPRDNTGEQQCGPDGSGSYFGPETVCPNAVKLAVNQGGKPKLRWEEMLRAPAPPAPPRCVPSPDEYCPRPSGAGHTTESAAGGEAVSGPDRIG